MTDTIRLLVANVNYTTVNEMVNNVVTPQPVASVQFSVDPAFSTGVFSGVSADNFQMTFRNITQSVSFFPGTTYDVAFETVVPFVTPPVTPTPPTS